MNRGLAWGTGAGAVAVAAVVLLTAARPGTDPPPSTAPPATAAVERTTLTVTEDVSGTLGFGEERTVGAHAPGTLTAVAAAGTVVRAGEALFAVDTVPVVLLHGTVPAYRELRSGDEGADVAQLEAGLSALGYTGFTVDDEFTGATADAVQDWQDDLGVTGTGRVELGAVVFAPGDVRVGTAEAAVGDAVGGGPVLTVSGTVRQVDLDIEVAYRALVAVGDPVRVELPGGEQVAGTVRSVGATAEAPADPDDPGAGATFPVQVDVAELPVDVFDRAPVTVTLVADSAEGVLAVPVSALLALAEGGYGVEVVEGGVGRIVAVDTGMFAGGRVEVSGGGVEEGTIVGVPDR